VWKFEISDAIQEQTEWKCLEITSHVLNNDQRAFINIKIGNCFRFTFNNQETSIDTRKKSPSVIKRDNERKELLGEHERGKTGIECGGCRE
jgi:uncharacterized protein YecT (DUF1311 family)